MKQNIAIVSSSYNIEKIPAFGDSLPHQRKSILSLVEQELNNLMICLEVETDEVQSAERTEITMKEDSNTFSNRLQIVLEDYTFKRLFDMFDMIA